MASAAPIQLRAQAELERRRRARSQVARGYQPTFRGSALEAQTCTAHEWMLAGPAETGKTFAALWRLDQLLRTTPKSAASLLRKVAADIGPTVLRTYKRVVALSGSGATAYGGEKPEWFDYPNGARLFLGGMDRPGKALSGERDWFYFNQAEEATIEDWEILTTRATGRGAVTDTPMIFGDCNPGPPTHWIINRPSLKVMYTRHEENPSLFDDAGVITEQGKRSMAILDALTGVRHKRLRLGLWVSAEGAVYDFDRSVHLIDRFEIPADWTRVRSIDFGFTNPFVCQWWALDGDGRMYLYREIYMSQRTVKVHSAQIARLERWYVTDENGEPIKYRMLATGAFAKDEQGNYIPDPNGQYMDNPERERIAYSIADHDAEDRETLAENRIGTVAATKAITPGIQKVQERLKIAGDGKPRLFVLRDSLVERDEELVGHKHPISTEQEFDSYMWPKGQDGKPIKEVPVDLYNHGMDALRYAVMKLDGARGNSAVGAFG